MHKNTEEATIVLCSFGGFHDVLTFKCEHGTDHDIEGILTAEEARCRIRPCSEQILTNGLCFNLQVGDVVAASRVPHNRSRNPPQLLYDASIQKVSLMIMSTYTCIMHIYLY